MNNTTSNTNSKANSNEHSDGDPLANGFGGMGIHDAGDLGSSPQDMESLTRNMYLPQYNPNFMDRFGGFNFNLPQPTQQTLYSSPQAQGLRYQQNLPQNQTAQSLGSQYPISPLLGNQYLPQSFLSPQQLITPQLSPQQIYAQQQQQQLLAQQLLAQQLLSQPLLTQQQQLLALQLGITPQQLLSNQYMLLQQQQQQQQSQQSQTSQTSTPTQHTQAKSPPALVSNPLQSQLQQHQLQLQLQQLQLNNSLLNPVQQTQLHSPPQLSNPLLTQQLYLQQQLFQQQLHQQQLQLQQHQLQQVQQAQQAQTQSQQTSSPVPQSQQSTQTNSPQPIPSPRLQQPQSSPRIQQTQQPQKSNSPLTISQKSQSPQQTQEQQVDHHLEEHQNNTIEPNEILHNDSPSTVPPPASSLNKSQEFSSLKKSSPAVVPPSGSPLPQQPTKPIIPLPVPLPTPIHAKLSTNGIAPTVAKLKDTTDESTKPKPPKKETTPSLSPAPKIETKPAAKPAWDKSASGELNGKDVDEEQPSRVLWVGNIGSDVTEKELADEFEPFGPLESIRILHDRFCAFVNFIIEEDAIAAKQAMQGQIVGSQYIVVNFRQTKAEDYVPPEPAPAVQPSRALYIGNLSEVVGEKELRKECEKFGEIESIFVKRNKNCAFVNFVTIKAAAAALPALQNKRMGDTNIKVNYGKSSPSSKDQKETPPFTTTPKLKQAAQGLSPATHKPTISHIQPNQPPAVSPSPQLPVNAWSAPPPLIKNQNRKVASPAPAPANWTSPSPAVKDTNPLTVSQEIGARDWMAENGLDICEVCYNSFRTTLFIPCHHTCCNDCMTKLRTSSIYRADKGSKCPFCQEVIKQYVSISTFNKQNKTS